jgi:hypothetical protein
VTNKKLVTPDTLEIVVAGDRRLTENLIVEVRATAREFGLDVSGIQIVRQSSIRPKASKRRLRRTPKKSG